MLQQQQQAVAASRAAVKPKSRVLQQQLQQIIL
jgi:hypothetical protein